MDLHPPTERGLRQNRSSQSSSTDSSLLSQVSSSSIIERSVDGDPSIYPVYLHCPDIPPDETERLKEIIQKLLVNSISRQEGYRRTPLTETTIPNRGGGGPSLSTPAPTDNSNGRGALPQATPIRADKKPARDQLDSLLGYEMAYFDILKSIPSRSGLPSCDDPITRWASLATMMKHYAALDPSYISRSSRSIPDRSAFRDALKCMWDIIHDGDKRALDRLNILLRQN